MGIVLKTEEEILRIRESSLLVAQTHAQVAQVIGPGVRTKDLDQLAETFIRDHGAEPAFKGYHGFPGSLCISINEQVVHGMPSNRELKEGDVVSVDCGVNKDGFFGDSAYTYVVGEVETPIRTLLRTTYESLEKGIQAARIGGRVGDIGYAIQSWVGKKGFGIVRELVGHGVGLALHEKPEVPNYGKLGSGAKLKEGMVLAIEPMINLGTGNVLQLEDGWTIITRDRKVSAHYEHTVAVGPEGGIKLSSFEPIEEILKARQMMPF